MMYDNSMGLIPIGMKAIREDHDLLLLNRPNFWLQITPLSPSSLTL